MFLAPDSSWDPFLQDLGWRTLQRWPFPLSEHDVTLNLSLKWFADFSGVTVSCVLRIPGGKAFCLRTVDKACTWKAAPSRQEVPGGK